MEDQNRRTDLDKFIVLELAGTAYGLRSSFVQQLEMVEEITPVPNATAAVEGVVFSRGQVIPAVNLRALFGFPKVPYDLRTRVVVIHVAGRTVGLIVDSAREFTTIPPSAIQEPPETITNLSGNYLEGIATIGQRLIVILNVEELVAMRAHHESVGQPPEPLRSS